MLELWLSLSGHAFQTKREPVLVLGVEAVEASHLRLRVATKMHLTPLICSACTEKDPLIEAKTLGIIDEEDDDDA